MQFDDALGVTGLVLTKLDGTAKGGVICAIARYKQIPLRFVGAGSVGVVTLSAIFTGLVLALQGYNALARFGSESLVGSLVALSLTRELAPVLTALMVTARAGSAMTAIIGNMAVTEQIDALDSLAVDPLSYLVLPRLLLDAPTQGAKMEERVLKVRFAEPPRAKTGGSRNG